MPFAGPGSEEQLRGIFCTNASADHYPDAISSSAHEFPDSRLPQHGGCFSAGGEHAVSSAADYRFECRQWMGSEVEGAMECDLHGARQRHQLARSLHIDFTAQRQQAEDHAIGAGLCGEPDVLLHDREIFIGVNEIATARTNHYVNADLDPRASCP